MLRTILIYLSNAKWMKNIVMDWRIARSIASRFIAGETLEEAINTIKLLNEKGMYATLDQLGENTTTQEEARKTGNDIKTILMKINQNAVISGISVKLTQIGLLIDEALCIDIMVDILELAKTTGNFVRIDMEDSNCVDATIRVYEAMKKKGYNNVGMVMQSYLYRAEEDTKKLLNDQCPIRLVKGAYKESTEVAYAKKNDVDTNFDRIMGLLIEAETRRSDSGNHMNGRWPPIPAAATHDENRISYAKGYANRAGLPKSRLEFQMLHGIRRDLQEKLVSEGYPVRIYVPFGTQWYPYFMRRLAERPANLLFFITKFFQK